MSKDVRQLKNQRYARIQKRRSESVRPGRGWRRCRTSSCWRRQRLSTTALAASRQQRPTANSETLTSPACCRTSRRLMLLSVVKEKAFQTTILRPTSRIWNIDFFHDLTFLPSGNYRKY